MFVVCNDSDAVRAMKRASQQSSEAGEHAAEYAAFAAAAEAHEIEYRFASGEKMGKLGKAAYKEGLRRLEE